MRIHLVRRVAPAHRFRLWVGAPSIVAAPAPPSFLVNGQPAFPSVVSSIGFAAPVEAPYAMERPVAGLFEFDLPETPLVRVDVSVPGGWMGNLEFRPTQVELRPDDWSRINVWLFSCCDRAQLNKAAWRAAINRAAKTRPPDWCVFMGDQVYLDLPTLSNFPDDYDWLLRKFERDYVANWFDRSVFGDVFDLAPCSFIPDDHEFWNNYPHPATVIQNSWRKGGSANWRKAALALFSAFQADNPSSPHDPVVLDMPGLSFFLSDTRGDRQADRSRSMTPGSLAALQQWVTRLNSSPSLGVVATGQPLLDKPTGWFGRTVADAGLPDYGDYSEMLKALSGARNDLLCLTGDVHWSRHATLHRPRLPTPHRMFEVISSPIASVTTVGADGIATGWQRIKERFGAEHDPWPRHGSASPPPGAVGSGVITPPWKLDEPSYTGFKGDQFVVLTFTRTPGKITVHATFQPIHESFGPSPRLVGVSLLN